MSLDTLNKGLVKLQEGGTPNSRAIEDSWLDQGVKKGHLSRRVLEVVSEALSLNTSEGAEPLVDFGLHGWSQAELRSRKLNPQVSI